MRTVLDGVEGLQTRCSQATMMAMGMGKASRRSCAVLRDAYALTIGLCMDESRACHCACL